MSWKLSSAEVRARKSRRFEIPSQAERRSLKIGDYAKLVFELDPQPHCPPNGERMWVKIEELTSEIPRRYVGELVCDPVVVDLERGARITFGPEHVADIDRGTSS